MNNHVPKKHSTEWYETLSCEDTRYYGFFLKGKKSEQQVVWIDMKRFFEYFYGDDDERMNLKTNKNGLLYKPAKSKELDYKVNIIKNALSEIKREWIDSQKIFIDLFLSEIKGHDFTAPDDDNFQMGIADYDEASTYARTRSAYSHQFADFKKQKLYYSLYAQYFHQLAAQIDAVILKLLTENGYELKYFDRGTFLAFKGPKGQNEESSITGLETYKNHERMYALWNFIKHNSKSTYDKVKEHCPEVLVDHEYKQGELACFYIQFSNDLIEKTIDGVKEFLIEYCEIVFYEDAKVAEWNYDDFFHNQVADAINEYYNPLGLPDY